MFTPEKLVEIRRLAEAGDANAQYALAAFLNQSQGQPGSRDESRAWLEKSAAQNHSDALFTLATFGFGSVDEVPAAIDLLVRAAALKNWAAQRQLAALLLAGIGTERDVARGTALMIDAARAGDPAAQREVAAMLILNDASDTDASAVLHGAATRDGTAAAVYVARAALGRPDTDTKLARALLSKLAAARYPHAAYLSGKLDSIEQVFAPSAPIDWDRIAAKLERTVSHEPEIKILCEKPNIKIFQSVVAPELCEYVIAHTARLLAPAKIVDPVTGQSRADSIRHSYTATIGLVDVDTIIVQINSLVAAIVGRPANHGEFLSILHYQPGQEYKRHYDWLPDGADVTKNGQRAATALLCLNDDYEGGETYFVSPDIKLRGRAGDLIVFENVTPDGEIDRETQHAGLPVESGAKWMASRWFRERIYRF